jgi:hypothetical protein
MKNVLKAFSGEDFLLAFLAVLRKSFRILKALSASLLTNEIASNVYQTNTLN